MKKLLFAFGAAALVSLGSARPARADTNFDLSAQTGIAKRFLSDPAGAGGLPGSFGPVLMLEGDVALMPLLRVGLYVDEELAVDGEPKAPFITSFGGRIKVTPPYLQGDKVRFWVFAGFGYSIVTAPGYQQTEYVPSADQTSSVAANVTIPAASGSFFEIPFGLGASYKVRAPWLLLGELSGRAAFGSSGEYFDPTGRNGQASGLNPTPVGAVIGSESFALFLTVGVGLEL